MGANKLPDSYYQLLSGGLDYMFYRVYAESVGGQVFISKVMNKIDAKKLIQQKMKLPELKHIELLQLVGE